jgi:hypothetical protein
VVVATAISPLPAAQQLSTVPLLFLLLLLASFSLSLSLLSQLLVAILLGRRKHDRFSSFLSLSHSPRKKERKKSEESFFDDPKRQDAG